MKVLMPTYDGGHVAIVIPLAKELIRRGVEVLILPFSVANLTIQKSGLPFISLPAMLKRVYSKQELSEIMAIGGYLAEKCHNPEAGIDKSITAAYYGVSMYCLIQQHGEAAWKIFAEKERKGFCAVDFMRRVIEAEQPDIVTATCDVRMEKAGIFAAALLNVHSIWICDFLTTHALHYYKEVDYVTTINERQRQIFAEAGFPLKKLLAAGNPAFDALFETHIDVGQKLKELGLDASKKTVLWAAEACPWVKRSFEEIKYAIHALPQYNFILKLHPTGNNESDFCINASNAVVLKHYNIAQLLHTADLVIGQVSTVLQQAMMLNKKILSLRVFDEEPKPEWADFFKAYPPETMRIISKGFELPSVIVETLNNAKSEKGYAQKRAFYIPIKNAAKNISAGIELICKTKRERRHENDE